MSNTISVNVVADVKNINKGIGDVNTKLGGMGKSLGKAGSALKGMLIAGAALAVGGKVVGFFKDSVTAASDFSESTSKVGVVFGKSAGQIIDASKNSAKAMGLSTNEYLASTGALGNLLVSLDIAPKAAAGMSQSMVALAGDLASFNNVSPEQALAAIQSGLTGETEPLKKFGVNMNEATLKAEALKMGLIKTTKGALTPQNKALAAQSLILAQTKTAQGDFGRTSGGLANQQRILAAQFDNVKTMIGNFLLPIITKLVTFLNKNLMPVVTEVIGGIKAFAAAFKAGGDDVTSAGFAGIMERIGLAARKVADFLTNSVIPAIKSFASFLGDNAGKLAVVAGVITAVFLPALVRMAVQSAISLGETIIVWGMLAASSIAATATSIVQFAIQGAKWVWMGITALASAAQIALAWIISMGPIALVIAAVIGLAILIVKNFDKIKSVISGAWTWVKEKTSSLWNGIKSAISAAMSAVSSKISSVMGSIKGAWNAAWSWVKGTVAAIWNGIKSAVSTGINGLMTYVTGLKGRILGALRGAASWLLNIGSDLVNGLKNGISNAWHRVTDMVQGLINRIPAIVRKALGINSPSRVFKEIGGHIGEGLVIGLDGMTGKVSKASGSMALAVSKGFGTPQLSLATAGAGGVGGRNYNVTVNAPVGSNPEEIGRTITEYIGQFEATGGKRWRN